MSQVPLILKIYDSQGRQVRTEQFNQEVIKVGTFPTAHLRLEDPTVAGMHAYIHVKGPDEIYISDLGSPRGTIVNGQKVNKSRLKTGDEVLLGQTKIVVEVGQAAAQPAAGPAAQAAAAGGPAMGAPVPGMGAPAGGQAGLAPGMVPGMAPGMVPGMAPGAVPGMVPGTVPGAAPAPEPAFEPIQLTSQDIEEVEAPGTAVEVQARYGGSTWKVVDLVDPRGGKPKPATLGLLGFGAVAFLAGVAMFGVALWQISKQKEHQAKVREFLKSRGLPEKYVPKVRGNPALAGGSVAGVVAGLTLLLWGFARYREEKESPDFTVGSDPKAKFHLSEGLLPKGLFIYPLVKAEPGGYKVLFWDGVTGEVEYEDGQKVSLMDLVQQGQAQSAGEVPGYAFDVPQNGLVRLKVGDAEFEVKVVRPGRRVATRGGREWHTWWYYGGSFALHAVFLLFLFGRPAESGSMESDTLESSSRFGKIAREVIRNQQKELEAKQKEEKPEKVKPTKEKIKTDQKGKGPVDERIKSKGAGGPPSPIKTSLRVSMARGAGMLGVLGRMSGKALASVFGREAAVSSDAENALGSLVGHTVGDAYGLGALGLGGGGRGGGGSGAGGIGLGAWGAGLGGGGGGGGGFGAGGAGGGYRIGRSKRGGVRVFAGTAAVQGSLDKSIIRRVIRRHLNEIRYCYVSRGLASNPKLSGQVKVQFVINTMGRVSSVAIAASSLNHPGTEACIKAAVRRWRFPKPEGGIVVVRYPFNFKPGGV